MTNEALDGMQPILLTRRLRLRPFTLADAPDVQRLAGDQAVSAMTLNIPYPYPDGAAEAWVGTHAAAWAAGRGVSYAVTSAGPGEELVGAVGLTITPKDAVAELGYWVAVRAWGQGYATEAAQALCAYAFASLGVYRIQARHFPGNLGSARVMQKLGMQLEGVLRGAVRKNGRSQDTALYSVLAPEWAGGAPELNSGPRPHGE